MRFLIDAQLPRRLARQLQEAGHDSLHTLDLPQANRTSDTKIIDTSILKQRIVVTKDADFVNSYWLAHRPLKLLLVSTGNITNKELQALFTSQLPTLAEAFATHSFIELTRTRLLVHE